MKRLFFRGDLLFLGRTDDHVGTLCSGNRAADDDDSLFAADLKDAEVLEGDAFVAHVTWHAHVFPNTTGGRAVTDGAVPAVHRGTVGHRLAMEVVLFYRALKAFALRLADNVNELSGFEDGDGDIRGFRSGLSLGEAELANEALWGRGG